MQRQRHSGIRGEEEPDWGLRSYALRDGAYIKYERGGKTNYINAKEYRIKKEKGDDLKVRLYSFSDEPSRNKLGNQGMTLEVERNGKTKFLNEMETEIFMTEIKRRTLETLFLDKSVLLEVER